MRRFVRKCAISVASRLRGFPIHPFNFSCTQKVVARSRRDAGKKAAEFIRDGAVRSSATHWYYECKHHTGTVMMDVILNLAIVAIALLLLNGCSWRDDW
jgi:hypothetical protein